MARDKRLTAVPEEMFFPCYDIDGDGAEEVMCGFGNVVFFASTMMVLLNSKNSCENFGPINMIILKTAIQNFWVQQILPVPYKDNGKLSLSCFNTVVTAGTMDTNGRS